ncbi:LOW QUALITY PROTEIN: UPF0462 protein C4orf33 homolog [Corapipo altera]|uniref:LOW QUALITY PROTEIN: UPF0462 protein C4orf33 homolog n=1 Tax=Corapipo altera TaxID=415028 RepID=UPI000FD6A85A|nr:LOW QUALITY PROTEIN: UPF0462 protein C4orf33 homolog [Corapipo altera]
MGGGGNSRTPGTGSPHRGTRSAGTGEWSCPSAPYPQPREENSPSATTATSKPDGGASQQHRTTAVSQRLRPALSDGLGHVEPRQGGALRLWGGSGVRGCRFPCEAGFFLGSHSGGVSEGYVEFRIKHTWDGLPVSHNLVMIQLRPDNAGLLMEVHGPFCNDPQAPLGESGKPFDRLWDYEVVEAFFQFAIHGSKEERIYKALYLVPQNELQEGQKADL